MGLFYWLTEDFNKAFELMEWRWKAKEQPIGVQFKGDLPTWNGEGKNKVFVWKEQGIGDEIMFSSTLFELNKISASLTIECDKRLIPIYKRSFPNNIEFVCDRKEICKNDYDAHIAIGSLPRYFRRAIDDFSKTSRGWLKANSQKTHSFRRRLKNSRSNKMIGISWFTKSPLPFSSCRNIPIDLLARYLQKIPATYVNLQYGITAQELAYLTGTTNFEIVNIDELDLFDDIDGLAALISACDTVISIDNLTVHLAGALGVDTRVLLPFRANERWSLSRRDSYWYDYLTLYRQRVHGDWIETIEDLTSDLLKTPE